MKRITAMERAGNFITVNQEEILVDSLKRQ